MSFVGDVVSGIFGGGGDEAADAAKYASNLQAQATVDAAKIGAKQQQAALDFYKQATAPSRKAQAKGLKQYQSAISSPLTMTSTQNILRRAERGDLYSTLLSGREEAAARSAAATGGLRGGQGISDITSVQNEALLSAYQNEQAREGQKLALQQQNISNLGSLAGLNTGSENIASMIAGIGQTQAQGILGAGTAQAQGITAAAQAQQQAQANQMSNLFGLGQLGIGAALAFSDERLKDNIIKVSPTTHHLINKYKWKWNGKAKQLGMMGNDSGYLAGEIESVWPDLVIMHESGYKQIDKPEIERRLEKLND